MVDTSEYLGRIGHLHQGTLRLMSHATELGDDFLQYLYSIALRDLEEKSGAAKKNYNSESELSQDPAIRALAAKLRNLASQKR